MFLQGQGRLMLTSPKTLLRVPGQRGWEQGGLWSSQGLRGMWAGHSPEQPWPLPSPALQGAVEHIPEGSRILSHPAASSCPTAVPLCLPHPWEISPASLSPCWTLLTIKKLFCCTLCCQRSLLLDVLPILALSSLQEDTRWTSCPAFTFLSSPVPFLQSSCLFLVHRIDYSTQVLCFALVSNLIPIFSSPKPYRQFVELIWILILLSNTFAVPPSLVAPPRFVSVLSFPSLGCSWKYWTEPMPSLLPEPQPASLPLLRACRGYFPHRGMEVHPALASVEAVTAPSVVSEPQRHKHKCWTRCSAHCRHHLYSILAPASHA